MTANITADIRCAVYTRKSTEHNLDLEFNYLDAQRESCEAYIKKPAARGLATGGGPLRRRRDPGQGGASKRKGMWMGGGVPLGYINRDKNLIIVPDRAETVRWIFRTYLEVGSIGRLLQKMDEQEIRSKYRESGDGRGGGGCRFGPGSLGYLLRNRGYVGEIAQKGQIHAGEHQPIIERELFDAVQAQLKSGAMDRKLKHAGTLHLLKGKLFDSAGNRMTPSHSVKMGVRYRYYVSQAILGNRPGEAGRVGRVSAPELEALVEKALRKRFASAPGQSLGAPALVESHLERAVVRYDAIELSLTNSRGAEIEIVTLDWQRKPLTAEKGLTVELPPNQQETKARDALLAAIGKARSWIKDLDEGITISDIAKLEGKGERQIRLLLPLAFAPPTKVSAIIDGTLPAVTMTELARSVPLVWG